jgi:hypothetical protein
MHWVVWWRIDFVNVAKKLAEFEKKLIFLQKVTRPLKVDPNIELKLPLIKVKYKTNFEI